MNPISPADVALEGFKVVRHKPQIILFWGVLRLITTVAGLAIMIATGVGAAMVEMQAISERMTSDPGSVDPTVLLPIYGQILNGIAPYLILALVFSAVLSAAAYRAVLKPASSAFGYLRLGADELRQIVVSLAIWVILFVIYFVSVLVAAIVGGILSFLLAMVSPALIVIPIFAAIIGVLGTVAYFAVRLSLAGPQTMAEARLNIFGSWALTKGRFWPIFGSYFIAVILGIVVALLGFVIAAAPAFAIGGVSGFTAVFQPNMTSLAGYFTPAMIAYVVVSAFVSAQTFAVFMCPTAAVYRAITGGKEEDVFA